MRCRKQSIDPETGALRINDSQQLVCEDNTLIDKQKTDNLNICQNESIFDDFLVNTVINAFVTQQQLQNLNVAVTDYFRRQNLEKNLLIVDNSLNNQVHIIQV